MKRLFLSAFLVTLLSASINAQTTPEKYGNTLNLGAGIGYYGYGTAPAFSVNYEFDVFKNFTLAPFVTVSSYRSYRYWGSKDAPYRDYYYRETTIPVGLKGSYYFDQLFKAGDRWDFYAAASLGVAFRSTKWENGYNGDRVVRNYASPIYGNLHIGAELHLNTSVGLFLDMSTGLSTFGLAIHI